MSNTPAKSNSNKRPPAILVSDTRNNTSSGRPTALASGTLGFSTPAGSRYSSGPRPSEMMKRKSYPDNSNHYRQTSLARSGSSSSYFYRSPGGSGLRSPSNSKFGRVSLDTMLSDVSDIPSAQRRATGPPGGDFSNQFSRLEGSGNSPPTGIESDHVPHLGFHESRKTFRTPSRLTQALPVRTTKLSEKLVLIPEDIKPPFQLEEDKNESGPPLDESFDTITPSNTRKTYAERLPKERRTEKFPRVTAYCISDGIRLAATARYLRNNHKISPRVYNEALYAPYNLPLLCGDDACRVKSSPDDCERMEELIDRSEQLDHHFEYYSGLESNTRSNDKWKKKILEDGEKADDNNGDLRQNSELFTSSWPSNESEFDPHEPQAFSPVAATHGFSQESSTSPSLSDQTTVFGHENDSFSSVPLMDSQNELESTISGESSRETSKQHELQSYAQVSKAGEPPKLHLHNPQTPDLSKHAEIFIFSYGVIVFWNFTEMQEKEILADLNFARVSNGEPINGGVVVAEEALPQSLILRPISEQDIETEELHFTYSQHTIKPRIFNDMITLRSGDHMIKLAMSHAISQSTKLSRFEARMYGNMDDVRHVPKMLALTGRLGLKREEVLKISGGLFKLRVDVNLSSNVLDIPDFFWEDEPSLNPLYTAVREYLEIEQRVLVLNERCQVFLDLTDIIADSIAEFNMSRITWIIIILIAMSLTVSTLEIAVRFSILKEVHKKHIIEI